MRSFSDTYPTTAEAIVPEYFKQDTIAGLAPGEIVYPYNFCFVSDAATSQIFVKTGHEVDADAKNPKYFGGRVGLMRIYEAVDGGFVDGYIADFRRVKQGDIGQEIIRPPEDPSPGEAAWIQERAKSFLPLSAAIFLDPDGNPHFVGAASLMEHAKHLIEDVDAVAPAIEAVTDDESQGEDTDEPSVDEDADPVVEALRVALVWNAKGEDTDEPSVDEDADPADEALKAALKW